LSSASEMADGSDRVEFTNVEVLAANQHVLVCRVAGKLVSIPPGRLLQGLPSNAKAISARWY